jgi:predicted TIM-barrel enzyme
LSDLSHAQNASDELLLYCPSAEGLAGRALSALCLLPIHDANGCLLEALGKHPAPPIGCYASVFAVDPFRRRGDIFASLRLAGFAGVANFPSVCLIDGDVRNELEMLGFGYSMEVDFIGAAVRAGLSAAALVDSCEAASAMIAGGATALIATNGAIEILSELAELAANASVPLVALTEDN